MQLQYTVRSLAGIEPAVAQLVRALHRKRRAAGSIPARDVHVVALFLEFTLDNFDLYKPFNLILLPSIQ